MNLKRVAMRTALVVLAIAVLCEVALYCIAPLLGLDIHIHWKG
jgi:hypothetical protein